MKSRTKSRYTSDKRYIGDEPKNEEKTTIPMFTLDADGRIRDVLTKEHGWLPIRKVNPYFLSKILLCIEKKGNKYSRIWYSLDQELKRRQSSGEIKPRPNNEAAA